jgi:hypothetical protein
VVAARRLRRLLSALVVRVLPPRERTLQLLPAELVLEEESDAQPPATIPAMATPRRQPPPIPVEARLSPTPARRSPTTQELAWEELMRGRHPQLVTGLLSRPAPAQVHAPSL